MPLLPRAIAACVLWVSAAALSGCAPTGSPAASAPESYAAAPETRLAGRDALTMRIAHYARVYDIPESLIHASVRRESNYNPAAKHGPYWGLMQIRHDTARAMGYHGPASGLLDADTNLSYGVPYLANAYKVAGGSERRAIQLYAGGYYYEAKRKGMLDQLHRAAQ